MNEYCTPDRWRLIVRWAVQGYVAIAGEDLDVRKLEARIAERADEQVALVAIYNSGTFLTVRAYLRSLEVEP